MMKDQQNSPSSQVFKSAEPPYFYVTNILETQQLSPEESRHAVSVLRLKEGDEVRITDGRGGLFKAYISHVHPKNTSVSALTQLPTPISALPALHMAGAPTKNVDRLEWVLEKLTEIGLASLHVVITRRTIRRKISLERLERVMIAAMKQSRKCVATAIYLHSSFQSFLQETSTLTAKQYIAYCGDEVEKNNIHHSFQPQLESLFLIGPEGDFTPDEVQEAVKYGFTPISLGEERLRTETAALYSGALHHIINKQNFKPI